MRVKEKTDNCSCIVCIYAIHGEISRGRSVRWAASSPYYVALHKGYLLLAVAFKKIYQIAFCITKRKRGGQVTLL